MKRIITLSLILLATVAPAVSRAYRDDEKPAFSPAP